MSVCLRVGPQISPKACVFLKEIANDTRNCWNARYSQNLIILRISEFDHFKNLTLIRLQ